MAHRLLRDPDTDGWERSDMPIVCESCLGPNPFVRMQRIEFGGTCHVSNRPYTVFRWRPGSDARYKKTVICQEVAKAKNVCQVCLLDLDYNLPVQVRDTALGIQAEDEPTSDVNKEFKLNAMASAGETDSSFAQARPNDMLMRLQRTTPYYKRNMAKVCSFFAKGACTRGAECPYRHEMPLTGELSKQNMKDRYYGLNDPVANKMMRKLGETPDLTAPEDTTITTLYVGGLTAQITEADIAEPLSKFGDIINTRIVYAKNCAFVTYGTRSAAEAAAEAMHNKLIVKGVRCRLLWGNPQNTRQDGDPSTSGRPGMVPPRVQQGQGGAIPLGSGGGGGPDFFNLGGAEKPYYPSMDPSNMGTRVAPPGGGADPQKRPAAEAGGSGGGGGGGGAQQDAKRSRPSDAAPPQRPQQHQQGPPPGQFAGGGGAPPPVGHPGAPPPGYQGPRVPAPSYPGAPPPGYQGPLMMPPPVMMGPPPPGYLGPMPIMAFQGQPPPPGV